MPLFDDSRAAWGAAANTNPRRVAPSTRLGVSWHYPGGTLTITPASDHGACLRQVKAWQTFHMSGRGWSDIGYNLLICQHARVIEGRGADLVGAHSPGVNVEHYGVQLMTSNATPPTAAMYARAVRLRADLESRSGRKLRQWGHQDDPAASTACPGPAIESWIRSGGPYATTPTPTPTQEDPVTNDEIERIAARTRDLILWAPAIPGASTDSIAASSVRNNIGLTSDAAYATLAVVRQLAASADVDVDETAIGAAIVAGIGPQLADAVAELFAQHATHDLPNSEQFATELLAELARRIAAPGVTA